MALASNSSEGILFAPVSLGIESYPLLKAPSLIYGDEISEVVTIRDVASFGTGWSSQTSSS